MNNIKAFTTAVVICAATITFVPARASANPALLIPAAEELVQLGAAAIGMYGVWNRGQHKPQHHNTVYSSTTPKGTIENAGRVSSQEECNKIAASRGGGKWRPLPVEDGSERHDPVTGKPVNPTFTCKIMKYKN